MPRLGLVAIIAIVTAAAEGFVPYAATAGPEQADQPDPVVVTLPGRAQFASPGAASDPTVGPLSQFAIVRETQKELRRLRCYEGENNGTWTPASRSAAQRFVDRVNAKLPTDKPDEILLALLRDQSDAVCGQCQRNEALDASDRCVPAALISKVSTPRPIATSSIADGPRADPAPADQTQASPETAAARRTLRSTNAEKTKYWSRWIKKVDRALGLY
jgi:hypothetical protein